MKGICGSVIFLLVFITPQITPQSPYSLEPKRSLSRELYDFANRLYDRLSDETGNIVFSPYSIYGELALVYQGSNGVTTITMQQALKFGSRDNTAAAYRDSVLSLQSTENVTLRVTNSMYHAIRTLLTQEFSAKARDEFFADLHRVEFMNPELLADQINRDVARATNNRITRAVSPSDINPVSKLLLVNTLYLKAQFLHPFNPQNTRQKEFVLNSLKTVHVDTMHRRGQYFYKSDKRLDAQIIKLDYEDDNLALVLVLPRKSDGLSQLEEKLSNDDLHSLTNDMSLQFMDVQLPKFKIDYKASLKWVLSRMGLSDIFNPGLADFSKMIYGEPDTSISDIIHNAYIKVNEYGTEAAAVTVVDVATTSAGPQPLVFNANHPFIYYVEATHRGSKNIMIMGRVSDPNED